MSERTVQRLASLSPEDTQDVLRLIDHAELADGVRPVDEQTLLHLRHGAEHVGHLLLRVDGRLAGYASLDLTEPDVPGTAEGVVHPEYRRRGHGRALARAVLSGRDGRPLRAWAHGGHPAADRLAGELGFARVRALWQMRRPLDEPLPDPSYAGRYRVRTFVPGRDEQAWLEVNRRAFADHPEQGRLEPADLRQREDEPWFDPSGFFLAEYDDGTGRIAGFHWTKVHDGTEQLGEVYVVGVDPDAQGDGLGRALTLTGLHHLRDRGLRTVLLYVDESNTAAIRMYESLGFTRWDTDVMYQG
ncbi:MAG: mycothiol synthase [Streptosporangiales bacterium]|nr:mycothiol synthase [Streptosporangiales bacterium]